MKKGLLVLLLISFLALPVMSLASRPGDHTTRAACEAAGFFWYDADGAGTDPAKCHGAANIAEAPRIPLLTGLSRIVDILFTVLIAVAVLLVMIGAFGFVTAGGNAEAVNAAREKILYAIVAVIVAFLARGIVIFLQGALPLPGT